MGSVAVLCVLSRCGGHAKRFPGVFPWLSEEFFSVFWYAGDGSRQEGPGEMLTFLPVVVQCSGGGKSIAVKG